jgi:hypothetical protein
MPLNLQNSFEDRDVQFPSSLLVDKPLRFAQNSFEKRQAETCRFSKEFCKNPGNVTTNRKERYIKNKTKKIKVHPLKIFKGVLQIQKLLVLSS